MVYSNTTTWALPSEDPPVDGAHLHIYNVALGFLFIVFDAVLSGVMGLGIGTSLVVAALRCVIQLSVMALVLQKVFESHNIWAVLGIALLLNTLGAIEATFNKSKRRFSNMFPCMLVALFCGSMPIAIVGSKFAMEQHPWWEPDQFIPILGMMLGNGISAIGVSMNAVQKEFSENRDRVETYLAMGANRLEAVKPIAVESLKMALLPTINQMSIIGLISIPGMMTGAIIGGKSVQQAARLQMIIMFMISAAAALATLVALYFALTTLVDNKQRIRTDRLDSRQPAIYRARDAAIAWVIKGCKKILCIHSNSSSPTEGNEGLLTANPNGRRQTPSPHPSAASGAIRI